MTGQREQAIRERAYAIWEQEGRPNGKDLDHWLHAEAEIGSCREYGTEQMRQDTHRVRRRDEGFSAFPKLEVLRRKMRSCPTDTIDSGLYSGSDYVISTRTKTLDEVKVSSRDSSSCAF
jgi:hypothetical protein